MHRNFLNIDKVIIEDSLTKFALFYTGNLSDLEKRRDIHGFIKVVSLS